MVIKELKAVSTALEEAMKDEKMSEATKKTLEAQKTALQKLIEAAKKARESYQAEKEEESEESETPEPEEVVEEAHKEGKKDKQEGKDGKDEDEDEEKKKESEESKKGYISYLLKESGLPKKVWNLEKLITMSLKEAKAEIAEKKNLLDEVRKAAGAEITMVPTSEGQTLEESDKENLNALFSGVAR